MRTAIIIDQGNNESLLRFTETKLFFDAKNQIRNLVDDCVVVKDHFQAQQVIGTDPKQTYFVIPTGAFLTTKFAEKFKHTTGVHWIGIDHELVIPFDPDTHVGFKKRSKYPSQSKQLYIIENMLRQIIAAKKNVYVENTEFFKLDINTSSVKHLFGLASGWKTPWLAKQIGLENLESITVYDANPTQLEWAKQLHSFKELPSSMQIPYNHVGKYNIPEWTQDWWANWHNYSVQFQNIDLTSTPTFPKNSLVWISNVFKFEPLIFSIGWERLKELKKLLLDNNKESIIIEL